MVIVIQFRLKLKQININGAFLNSLINIEIYMHQSPDYVNSQFSNHTYKLTKRIYDLKQASRI
jgi:Reverse transcriptase (RNA-dependent DNA polymerase)